MAREWREEKRRIAALAAQLPRGQASELPEEAKRVSDTDFFSMAGIGQA